MMSMGKETENTSYLYKFSVRLDELAILNTKSMKPGYHNISELCDLEKDRKLLIYKLEKLQDLRNSLCIRVREIDKEKEEILKLVRPIYENGEKVSRCVELKVMHWKIKALKKEQLILSQYLKQVKDLECFIRSGLGGIDYIKRNNEEICSFYVATINRFHITLYNKIK